MLSLNDINALNIEASSRCIANCRFCSRHQKKSEYGDYFISLNDFKKLPESLLKKLRRISFDGNFGDLSSNEEFTDIAAYIKSLNPDMPMCGHSHASCQDAGWWAELGRYFKDGYMVFALDGLKDTHRLHRRGVDFDKVMENIKAFTTAGGAAWVQTIVFEHNEHQIMDIEALARDLGASVYFAISSRDYDDVLKPPRKVDFQVKRDVFQDFSSRLEKEETKALCKPVDKGSIYLAADGTVHPCCLAHCMYITDFNKQFRFIISLIEKYKESINFKTTPIEEIISGPYFQEAIRIAENNPYCRTKCNRYKDRIRQELVIHEAYLKSDR